MKKLRIIFIILCVAVLTSCAKHGATNNFEKDNLQLLGNSNNLLSRANKAGMYEISNFQQLSSGFNILFTDFNSHSKIVLCSNSSCMHDNEYCPGFIKGKPLRLFVTEDKLIFISLIFEEDNYHKELITKDLNGENTATIYKFDPAEMEGDEYLFDGQNIIFIITKPVKAKDEVVYQQYLSKINIYNGEREDTVNLSEKYDSSYLSIIGSLKDSILVKIISNEMVIDSLKINGSLGAISKKSYSYDDALIKYFSNYCYYASFTNHIIIRKDLVTGEEKSINFPDNKYINVYDCALGNVFDNKLIFTISEIDSNKMPVRNDRLYYFDFEEEKCQEVCLTYLYDGMTNPIVIVRETEDSFLVLNNIENITYYYPESEKGIYSDIVPTPQYAMISKQDYFNSIPNYTNINNDYLRELI